MSTASSANSASSWRAKSRRFLRACAPRRLLENLRNPILQKEVFVSGRKRSTYVVRCVSLLILLAIVTLLYIPILLEHREYKSGLQFMQSVQELAPAFTLVVIWFEYVTLLLIGPSLLGGSLCDERRSGTLGALLTTPLTAFQIALGKLLAGLSQLLILVLLALPLILALRVFGGVQLGTVLGMASVVVTSALLACTLSLFYSARAPRGSSAAGSAIASMMVLHGGVSIAIMFVASRGLIALGLAQSVAATLCGPAALGLSSAELTGNSMGAPVSAAELCLYNSLYSLALTGLAFFALVVRLRKVMLKDAGGAVVLLTRKEKRKNAKAYRAAASATPAVEPQAPAEAVPSAFSPSTQDSDRPLIEHDSREVGDRPVLWRELAQPAFKSRFKKWFTIVVIVALLLYLHSQLDGSSDRHGANLVILGVGLAISLFVGTGAAAASFAQERESRTLDVLMTTPLSAREVIYGKFWGAMRRQWFLPSVLLVHLLVTGVLAAGIPFVAIIHALIVVLVPLGFVTAVGVWMSVRSKKSTGASVKTALICLALWVLPFPAFFFLGGVASSLGMYNLEDTPVGIATIVNPVYLAISCLTRPNDSFYNSSMEYSVPFELFGSSSVGFLTFTVVFVTVMGGYAGLAWLALQRARILLGRETNRLR